MGRRMTRLRLKGPPSGVLVVLALAMLSAYDVAAQPLAAGPSRMLSTVIHYPMLEPSRGLAAQHQVDLVVFELIAWAWSV